MFIMTPISVKLYSLLQLSVDKRMQLVFMVFWMAGKIKTLETIPRMYKIVIW